MIYLEDPVDDLEQHQLYVIGAPGSPWQVEMVGPYGCDDRIVLPNAAPVANHHPVIDTS